MKRNIYIFLLIVFSHFFSSSVLGNTCGNATWQLQNYVQQVNTTANAEYYQGIPWRCRGNRMCMQQMLNQLNYWYNQQSSLVNNWYREISMQCSQRDNPRRLSRQRQTRDEPGEIDEDEIEDMEIDDEDKTVRIRIPSTPDGFQ